MEDLGEVGVLPHPVAAAAYVDDMAVMQEAIDECSGHDLVTQDLTPLLEPFVGREDGGCALIAPVDELEEEHGAGRADRQVADLVDDQERGIGEDLEAASQLAGGLGFFERRDEVGQSAVVDSASALSRGDGEGAEAEGAAAVFDVLMLPGNLRYQAYPSGTDLPAFSVGSEDGYAVRDLIAAAAAGSPPRVHVAMKVDMTPGLETALVWGTLPGRTDETIYIIAHRDGWFDAAGDNASGIASMLGLAEHYSKIPRSERRRTILFVGLDGHHNSGEGQGVGRMWMVDQRDELFAKTALVINAEHPSTVQTTVRPRYQRGNAIVWANSYTPQQWYAGGPSRPELNAIAVAAFREFGVSTYLEPNPQPPAGDLGRLYRFVPGVATSDFYHYFHTDLETPETVPWTGLEASTRAYARIVDGVNKLDLSVLRRPEEPTP